MTSTTFQGGPGLTNGVPSELTGRCRLPEEGWELTPGLGRQRLPGVTLWSGYNLPPGVAATSEGASIKESSGAATPFRLRTSVDTYEVTSGSHFLARVEVSVPGGAPRMAAEWGEPVRGGICRPGEPDPVGWFAMPIAGVGRWGTLDPDHAITVVALVGTAAVESFGSDRVPPGPYEVVVPFDLPLDGRRVHLVARGPRVVVV